MTAYKDFVKLLADIEIYVDGMVQNLNAAHINEDEYFRHVVQEDMDGIIKSIKDSNRQDSTSAPETDFVQELKQGLEFVSSIEGSAQKKQVALYCRQLGIDYTKLTEVKFEAIMRVLQKFKHLKGRGKRRRKK